MACMSALTELGYGLPDRDFWLALRRGYGLDQAIYRALTRVEEHPDSRGASKCAAWACLGELLHETGASEEALVERICAALLDVERTLPPTMAPERAQEVLEAAREHLAQLRGPRPRRRSDAELIELGWARTRSASDRFNTYVAAGELGAVSREQAAVLCNLSPAEIERLGAEGTLELVDWDGDDEPRPVEYMLRSVLAVVAVLGAGHLA